MFPPANAIRAHTILSDRGAGTYMSKRPFTLGFGNGMGVVHATVVDDHYELAAKEKPTCFSCARTPEMYFVPAQNWVRPKHAVLALFPCSGYGAYVSEKPFELELVGGGVPIPVDAMEYPRYFMFETNGFVARALSNGAPVYFVDRNHYDCLPDTSGTKKPVAKEPAAKEPVNPKLAAAFARVGQLDRALQAADSAERSAIAAAERATWKRQQASSALRMAIGNVKKACDAPAAPVSAGPKFCCAPPGMMAAAEALAAEALDAGRPAPLTEPVSAIRPPDTSAKIQRRNVAKKARVLAETLIADLQPDTPQYNIAMQCYEALNKELNK